MSGIPQEPPCDLIWFSHKQLLQGNSIKIQENSNLVKTKGVPLLCRPVHISLTDFFIYFSLNFYLICVDEYFTCIYACVPFVRLVPAETGKKC